MSSRSTYSILYSELQVDRVLKKEKDLIKHKTKEQYMPWVGERGTVHAKHGVAVRSVLPSSSNHHSGHVALCICQDSRQ